MNKLTECTEQTHSTKLIALIQSANPLSKSEKIAQPFVNLIKMAEREKQNPSKANSRVKFDEQAEQSNTKLKLQ